MAGFDDFDTVALLDAHSEMPRPVAFLKDTFFSNERTFETESVQVDLFRGKRRMAPFVARYQLGRALLVDGFQTQTHTPPKFAPERTLPAEDLLYRGIGEHSFGGQSPTARAAEILSRDMFEVDASITRREEWMCSNAIFRGSIAIRGDGGGEFAIVYDPDELNPNTPVSWEDVRNADPMLDLAQMQAQVRRHSGVNPNIAILSADAATAFIRNLKVQSLMNVRNLHLGDVRPTVQSEQIAFICRLTFPSIEVYTYDEYYLDIDAEGREIDAPFIPPGSVLVGATNAPGFMVYGGIIQYEPPRFGPPVTYASTRVPLLWTDIDNQLRRLRMTSRPLPVPMDVKGHFGANALGKGNPNATFPNFTDIWVPPTETSTPATAATQPKNAAAK
jgi:Phage major capsid protein E